MTDSTKLNLDDIGVLNTCAAIEETCAAIYHYFSECYGSVPRLGQLWEKTACEEDNHARQFQLASRLRGQGIASLKSDPDRARSILDRVRSVLEKVRKGPPSPGEALRLAIKMERSLSEFHMDEVAVFEDRELARLFESMMKNDQEHIRTLELEYEARLRDGRE